MQICQIPFAYCTAVENMAIDAVMLAFGKATDQSMWRAYGWSEPAITFGYAQRWAWVELQFPDFPGKLVRRLTGGGIVDHRHDLTYALSLPPSHPFFRLPASRVYQQLHELIANVLMENGVEATLKPCLQSDRESPRAGLARGICFEEPEPFDVIHPVSGRKIAGAAMKRSRSGILIQGSLARSLLTSLDRPAFETEFGLGLAHWLKLEPVRLQADLPEDLHAAERLRFASRSWNRKR